MLCCARGTRLEAVCVEGVDGGGRVVRVDVESWGMRQFRRLGLGPRWDWEWEWSGG